jgi:hypothetical protein
VRLSEARGIGGKVEKLWAATSELTQHSNKNRKSGVGHCDKQGG